MKVYACISVCVYILPKYNNGHYSILKIFGSLNCLHYTLLLDPQRLIFCPKAELSYCYCFTFGLLNLFGLRRLLHTWGF